MKQAKGPVTEWAGRRVLVVGLGISGFAAARALVSLDAKVRVTEGATSDEIERRAAALRRLGAEVETTGHDLGALDADVAVVSPGISPGAPVIQALRDQGTRVVSEVELAYGLARCDFLAVTGTNGKTTTTSLLAAMLAEGKVETAAAGNIGSPLVEAAMTLPKHGAIVVEVSSFQLATIERFRPRIAVLLNIAEDHTDWHGSFESYVAAKERLIENQQDEDVFVYNYDDPRAVQIAGRARSLRVPFSGIRGVDEGAGVHDGAITYRGVPIVEEGEVPLPGVAGLQDATAAVAAGLEFGIGARAVASAVKRFRPLPHRLQVVAQAGGVTYIDDSKATNPHATVTAVKGLSDVVLIAGGRSKGIDLSSLRQTVPPVKAVVALGEASAEVMRAFEGLTEIDAVESMEQAVARAHERAHGKGSVLLSPGCASLDMYSSYAARGDDFAKEVARLLQRQERSENGGS